MKVKNLEKMLNEYRIALSAFTWLKQNGLLDDSDLVELAKDYAAYQDSDRKCLEALLQVARDY